MKKLSPNDSLNEAIALLATKRDRQLIELKEQFHAVHESVKPINLIKDTFNALTASPDLRNGIGKTVIGAATGFLVKNILFRNSYNPLKVVAGIVMQRVASSFASKNSDKIKFTGLTLFRILLSKLKHNKNGVHESEIKA